MSDGMMQFHSAVGTGAGVAQDKQGRSVPVVTMHFTKDPSFLERLEDGDEEFDPDDGELWHSFALSIRGARQLVEDLKEAIESAIEGPAEHE